MKRREQSIVPRIDRVLIILYLVLVGLGWMNIYSSSFQEDHPSFHDMSMEYGKQLFWIGVSLSLAVFILLLEGSFIRKQAYIIYLVILFMLVIVLFLPPIKGARSWFGFGNYGVQPSEFAKYAVALALARYLSTINIKLQDWNAKIRALMIMGVPAFLILLQPDPGTVLIFLSFILVLYREGLSGNILLFVLLGAAVLIVTVLMRDTSVTIPLINKDVPGITAMLLVFVQIVLVVFLLIRYFVYKRDRKRNYILLGIALVIVSGYTLFVNYAYDSILKDRHRTRIELFLGLQEDPDGKDYNRNRAMAAVGSGGFSGKGYMNAKLANARHGHVPEQSTDFAYCTLSEEWGFIGSTVVIILFMFLLIRLIIIAERQRSQFTRIYAYAVTGVLFFHFMINVGMTIGLAPVIGIPLPFFSYGGSSLLAFTMLIFTLVRLDAERMDVLR